MCFLSCVFNLNVAQASCECSRHKIYPPKTSRHFFLKLGSSQSRIFLDNSIVLRCHKNKKLCVCVCLRVCLCACVYMYVCLCGGSGGGVITHGTLSWTSLEFNV